MKIRGFRVEPGEVEAVLVRLPGVTGAAVIARPSQAGNMQLAAFVTGDTTPVRLREQLTAQLPDYLVPAGVTVLDSLPETTTGKIDRRALSGLRTVESGRAHAPPQTPAERALAEVWQGILGETRVGRDDNFFELGGDSISGLQVVARARQAGYLLSPQDLFRHQTLARLAAAAREGDGIQAEQGRVTGELPATPIQAWFFEQDMPERHHYNHGMLLKPGRPLNADHLRQAAALLQEHHDALRLRFQDGQARLMGPCEPPFQVIQLNGVDPEAVSAHSAEIQASLKLDTGPIWRMVYFHSGVPGGDRLLVVIHHLAVDGVSQPVLMEDFATALTALSHEEHPQLPAKTTSLKTYSERLRGLACNLPQAEHDFWLNQPSATPLPRDGQNSGSVNQMGGTQTLRISLSQATTHNLLHRVPAAWRVRVDDLLICALARTLASVADAARVRLALESHGRDTGLPDLDLSRTVGWFTSLYPVTLDLTEADEPGACLKAVKQHLCTVPRGGIGYGLLRYLGSRTLRETLAAVPNAEVTFNYLGRRGGAGQGGLFALAPEPVGPEMSPTGVRDTLLEINAAAHGDELHLDWRYHPAFHHADTIRAWADDFRDQLALLIDHCLANPGQGLTPADFPLVDLTQAQLDHLENVATILPLSPMQEGMLFHHIYEGPGTGNYFEQMHCTLCGELDRARFRKAWQLAADRHHALRAAFHWEGFATPIQRIARAVDLPWVEEDWRHDHGPERLDAWLARDRARGFDITAAPLMRFALLQTGLDAHIFVWSHHHLLLDGWSLPNLLQEVFGLYRLLQEDAAPTLPEPPAWPDYLAWLAGRDPVAARAFWQTELSGLGEPTPLPAANEPLQDESPQQAHVDLLLNANDTGNLNAAARRLHITPATLVQGAWALLLARYTAKHDVTFGTTVSGRPMGVHRVEDMVGLFINTLPVRVTLDDHQDAASWLQQLHQAQGAREAFAHTPLTDIQAASDLPADLHLFETIVVFENYPVDNAMQQQAGDLAVMDVTSFVQTHNPLTLVASPGETLSFRLNYRVARFATTAVRALMDHFKQLLLQLAAANDAPLHTFDMMDEAGRQAQLVTWNQTTTDYPREADPASLVAEIAGQFPDRPALDFGPGKPMTYAQLIDRADAMAGLLQRRGVGLEIPVGLMLPRSTDMVVSMLAIVRAGGVYVPLDPDYPAERLSFMARDAGLALLIVDGERPADLPCPILTLNEIHGQAVEATPPFPELSGGNLAYMIYTSGSTGRPKGTMIPHRSVVRLVRNTNYLVITPDDRVAQTANASFDAITLEVWGALLNGACLVGVPTDLILQPERCIPWLRDKGVSVLWLTTSLFHNYVQHDAACFQGFRAVIFGGEAMDTGRVGQVLNAGGPQHLINGYGPTESTTFAVTLNVTDVRDRRCRIGHTIANTTAYVLDHRLTPVAVGVPGELLLGGDGLARGYLGRPGLTAERFIPHPFISGERLYRTGDLVRRLSDGQLEYLGRMDAQVKIRGFRIEPAEIRHVLEDLDGVTRAEVIARNTAAGKQLIAYVQGTAATDTLQTELSRRLPAYMVPSAFVTLDVFPLTPNGKLDRRALPEPGVAAGKRIAPRNHLEESLWHIWSDILETDAFGVTDNFFDLGGHSLTATRAVSQIRDRLEREVPLRRLFETPTIAGLAVALKQADQVTLPPIQPVDGDGPIPLSFAQQRLWFFEKLRSGGPTFNLFQATWLDGPLDTAALTASLNDLAARHDILRTTFHDPDGTPVQVVAPFKVVDLPLIDLSGMAATRIDMVIRVLAERDTRKIFDLERGPLLRVSLFRLDAQRHMLFANQHHIISDGWSMGILIEELAEGYRRHLGGEGVRPQPPAVQYADYARWQQEHLGGEKLDAQLAWWRERLKNMPSLLNLPTDRPRPVIQSSAGGQLIFQWDADLAEALRGFCQARGATLFTCLQAVFATLLHRYSNQDDFAIGTPFANRGRAEIEPLIGFFVNTLVLRQNFSDQPSFGTLLARAAQEVPDVFSHADIPFERVVDALQPVRNTSHTPLFQTMFVLQNTPEGSGNLPGVRVSGMEHEIRTAQFDLSLEITERSDGLHAALEYNTDLFNRSTAERFWTHLTNLTRAILANPDLPVTRLDFLTWEERDTLVTAWGGTTEPRPLKTLAALFADQAATHPNAPAVIMDRQEGEPETLTYAQLDRRAERLAAVLHGHGAGPEKVVAVHAERTVDWVCGMLAVWKAGGVYLPLDPALPVERLRLMLEETEPVAVLARPEMNGLLPDIDAPVIDPEAGADPVALSPTDPACIAYVIYTSGSTGRPKGVMGTHQAMNNLAMEQRTHFEAGPGSRVLQFFTASFDASLWEIVMALMNGGALVSAEPEALVPGPELADLLERRAITHATMTPSVLANTPQRDFPDLKVLVTCGEACSIDLVTRFAPGRKFFNAYGPTETAICGAMARCRPGEDVTPIGRPLTNFSTYVLDPALHLTPVGVPGELCIGGLGPVRGYLNRPHLTAERFIPDPFGKEPGGRLYRTGDLVRYLPDGQIDFLGRVDHQVKLRGFRIELDEVTTAVLQSPAVAEAVSVVKGDRLVSYVVPTEAGEGLQAELRAFLSAKLPAYMVPSLFVTMNALPLTSAGKVNRRALPEPDFGAGAEAYVAPRTPVEKQLAAIWAEVLQLERVGVTDNFFDIGGYSLLATQVISRIRRQFEMEIPLAGLFEDPTIAQLSGLIEAALLTHEAPAGDDMESGDFDDLEEGEI
ncbi:MAG: amino acid adenylation domain-containing protein [Acidobacteriota bacterium]|nr:amino acid adenylation domain-containing protein [Acidobacteriota bacterium]